MAIPTRAQQISRVADFLADDSNEDRSPEELAKIVIDSVYDMWGKEMTDPPLHPQVGMAFNTPFLTGPHFVGWMGEEFGKEWVWVISATTDYGTLVTPTSPLWRVASASTAKSGAPGTNADNWEPGQTLSLSQGRARLSVLSVGLKTVLMRNRTDLSLWAESNANMKKYYKKVKE